jgi:hypothetical protein
MKPETSAILSFLVSLIAYEFWGLLVLFATATSSPYSSATVATGSAAVAIFAIVAALLTGLKVYAHERS